MRCTNCNSEVADGMQFCPYCGSPISISMPKVCSKCGTEIEEGEKFCTNCGSPIVFPEQLQHPQQGQPQQPQQGLYQQPYQGQYQQPQQGQYQQPYQGQYQQPQQGQYQQPYQGQYQQSQQGQYQQPYQGQYQQPNQGQYQQPYVQQKPQLPHRPQLTFMEAINIASRRLQEYDGRSRRSEFWWWYLVVIVGTSVLSMIPYIGALAFPAEAFLLYGIFLRRLYDCSAPTWLCKTVSSCLIVSAVLSTLLTLAFDDVRFAQNIVDFLGFNTFIMFTGVSAIWLIVGMVFAIKDSNPEIDPMHGPSPKYTL